MAACGQAQCVAADRHAAAAVAPAGHGRGPFCMRAAACSNRECAVLGERAAYQSIPLENHGVVCASVIALPVRQSSGVLWSTPAGPQPPSHNLYLALRPPAKAPSLKAPSTYHEPSGGWNGGWSGAAARLGRSLRAPCLSPSHFRCIAAGAVADRGRANARLSPPRPEQQGSRMGQKDRWQLCW